MVVVARVRVNKSTFVVGMQTQYFETRTEFFEFGNPVKQYTQGDHNEMGAREARRVSNMSHKGDTL